MTDHEHAATGPGPGTGPRPAPGTGPADAAPAATEETGAASAGMHSPPTSPSSGRAQVPDRFRRDREHKMIAGVCEGLGRQTDMDPVIFRITLAVLSATGGSGLIFYGFAWLLVPYEDEGGERAAQAVHGPGRRPGAGRRAVRAGRLRDLLTMLRNGGVLAFATVLSLLLAGAGYWSRRRGAPDPDPLAAQAAADAPPEARAPPVVTTYPSWWRDPIVKDGTHVGGTGYLWGPGDARERDLTSVVDVGIATPWTHRGRYSRRAPRRRDRAARAGSAAGCSCWPCWRAAWAPGTAGTRSRWARACRPVLACALAVFGLGIALSAVLGRTGGRGGVPGPGHGGAARRGGGPAPGHHRRLAGDLLDAGRGGSSCGPGTTSAPGGARWI